MRVAITGSGGTGKTRLATALAEHYGYPLIEEGVREFMKISGIKDLRSLPPEKTMEMQWWLFNHKIEKETGLENFIADRSTIDNMAYVLRWCSRQAGLESDIEKYLELARRYSHNTYDLIIFLPWGKFEVEADGVRSAKRWYQYEMDRLLWGLLCELNGGYSPCLLNASSVFEERLAVAIKLIDGWEAYNGK